MSTLEDAINKALERGEFVHLSVTAMPNGKFIAAFASASRASGYETAEAGEPVVALLKAISAAPMARKRFSTVTGRDIDDEALL